MKKRILSLLLVFCMVVTMLPTSALANTTDLSIGTSSVTDSGEIAVCEHEHNEECGYKKAIEGISATEETPCDKACEGEHSEDCAYVPATEEIPAVEGSSCTHECEPVEEQPKDSCTCDPTVEGEGVHTSAECPLYEEKQVATCNCINKCTLAEEENEVAESINADCPVCGAENADLSLCVGAAAVLKMTPRTTPTEQFTLPIGETYYFDLSAEKDNIGTIDTAVPDTTLHYVPFTYAGTVNAYSLDSSSSGQIDSSASATSSDRSLFVAEYNVSHTVPWSTLKTNNLIFGKTFDINYELRSLSGGSKGNISGGTPTTNEWDQILTKSGSTDNATGYIKNWSKFYSWGQDASSDTYRAVRGSSSAAYWKSSYATIGNTRLGWRPALEVLNPATLGSDGLKAVTLNLNGGSFNSSTNSIKIVCAGTTFTAPSATGLTRPNGDTGTYFKWLGSDDTVYEVGAPVPNTVTSLTAQWAEPPVTEQFNLTTGQTYYFDLSGEKSNIGAVNAVVPDTSLHYVPFTYAGTVNAYSLETSDSGTPTTEERADAQKSDRSLFVADYNVSRIVSWNTLDTNNLIFGKDFDTNYKLRSLSGGSSGNSSGGTPTTNEWDSILGKSGLTDPIKNWSYIYSWGQDTSVSNASCRALRGSSSAAGWGYASAAISATSIGWRPALEVLNTDTLTSDGLKAVTLNLNGGSFDTNGSETDGVVNSINIVCAGDSFIAPSATGLTRPSGNTDTYFKWLGSDDTVYEVGATVPNTVTSLTAQWAEPVTTYTLTVTDGTGSGNYESGSTVNITADTPPSGKHFKEWISVGGGTFASATSAATTFTMPANATTVTATFTIKSSDSGGGGSSYDYYDIKIIAGEGGTASPDGGSDNILTVREYTDRTFTFTPNKGYVVEDVLVDGKSVGAVSKYTLENIRRNHTIKVSFKRSSGHTNPQTGVKFDDVKQDDWFYDSVMEAVAREWFAGTSSTTFSPYLPTTRGMIATVLYRMENEPTTTASSVFAKKRPPAMLVGAFL